ncbi:MAG: glutathione S-transferase family protein [Myxococcales bacterium]|nr:glutathione S-transferase family protein [Myxococcales bacterium]MCB9542439.1 glutathione S-transferase family protein [Myxococcales bacterium]
MAHVQLFAPAASSYAWSTRIALNEAGVDYDLVPRMPNSAEQRAVHPFGKVPALRHGDFVLYETAAILEYIAEAFEGGAALVPKDVQERARMRQWMGVLSSYVYPAVVSRVVVQRVFVQANGGTVDEDDIALACKQGNERLAVLDAALGERQWLAGGELSLADILLAPVVFYASVVPDGAKILDGLDNLKGWLGRMQSRPSFSSTMPRM